MLSRAIPISIVFSLFLSGCIERYYPDDEDLHTGTLVVVAQLNSFPEVQTIYLSRSTSLQSVLHDPVIDCFVQIEREDGEVRDFTETEPGAYSHMMDEEFLKTGSSYRLLFATSQGDQYESEFEIIHPAPGIDSVYFLKEYRPTSDPALTLDGIQFYIDFEIQKDSGKYLRWQLEETFEYHLPDYRTRKYGTDRLWYDVPASEKWLRCWISRDIPDIFTLDLGNVDGTIYQKMPLNYVSSETQRLHHRYSMLVRQLAMSEKSFWYWNELGKNVQTKGGLFDTQPALTPSNICNVNKEDELIIGFFSISGVTERRIFVDNVPDLYIYRDPYFCTPGVFPMFLHRFPQDRLPLFVAYITLNGYLQGGEIDYDCVDCREQKGSSLLEPAFW